MAYEQKPNTGSLFKNQRKEPGDSKPDYTGTAMLNGVEHWLDAWLNEIKTGENAGQKYMSVKFKPKEARTDSRYPTTAGGGGGSYVPAPTDLDDEVPFISSDISLEGRVG